jgi:hypothetical protein
MPDPTAYPLAWPPGWPRTEPMHRERWPNAVALAPALKELRDELRLLGTMHVVLSSNATLGAETPADPGVVAYCTYQGQQVAIPCDRWTTLPANVRAIAKTINAMRGMQRWGAKHMIRAMFQGFAALPAPADWRSLLGNPATLAAAEAAFRERAKTAHPDAGGTHDRMAALTAAIAEARRVLA